MTAGYPEPVWSDPGRRLGDIGCADCRLAKECRWRKCVGIYSDLCLLFEPRCLPKEVIDREGLRDAAILEIARSELQPLI